ncbi:hypothetical protein PENCOP_c007G00936 [Penicillium coprophilum]|uniref:Myb-like domain-containing protein n=1 Tax=Penicillium coprophilum TaxID=36646 RepID=A0A1V6UKR9_9EURO|nr:hypothetical protein PENCOP_c007G00936 [Penicillium coprophilum]
MAPKSNELEAPTSSSASASASTSAPARAPAPAKPKLKIKGPAKVETKGVPKANEQEFLLTLLGTTKADYEIAATRLGIKTPACRMRFIRLQQKYGFKDIDAAEDNAYETKLKDSSNE